MQPCLQLGAHLLRIVSAYSINFMLCPNAGGFPLAINDYVSDASLLYAVQLDTILDDGVTDVMVNACVLNNNLGQHSHSRLEYTVGSCSKGMFVDFWFMRAAGRKHMY